MCVFPWDPTFHEVVDIQRLRTSTHCDSVRRPFTNSFDGPKNVGVHTADVNGQAPIEIRLQYSGSTFLGSMMPVIPMLSLKSFH
jgi:hypothetical protein